MRGYRVAVIVLLLAAGALWGSHLTQGVPFVYHPDEPAMIARAIHMVASGDLNPHWFHYPTLPIYLQAVLVALVHALTGLQLHPGDQVLFEGAPAAVVPYYVCGRVVSVIFALATTLVLIELVRRLTNRPLSLLAGAAFVASGLVSRSAVYVTVDMALTFFVTLSTFLMIRAAASTRDPRFMGFWPIVLCASLAAAMKYNGALLLLVFAAVLFFRRGTNRRAFGELALYAVLAIAVFVATNPYAVIDWSHFVDRDQGFVAEVIHYSSGHVGADSGSSAAHALETLLQSGSPLIVLAPASLLLIVRLPPGAQRMQLVTLFDIVCVLAAPVFIVRVYFERNALPLVPPLLALSMCVLAAALEWLANSNLRAASGLRVALGALVVAVQLAAGRSMIGPYIGAVAKEDPRTAGYRWTIENVPRGARIFREAFTPHVHLSDRFRVTSRFAIGEMPFSEIENEYDYVMTSEVSQSFAGQSSTYAALFSRKPLFVAPGEAGLDAPRIRIDSVTRPLPPDLDQHVVFLLSDQYGFGDVFPLRDVALTAPEPGRAGPLILDCSDDDSSILLPELPALDNKRYLLRAFVVAPIDTKLQIFYATPDEPDFLEKNSVQRTIFAGDNRADLWFGPSSLRGRIRLDPGDRPGMYVVRFIALYAFDS